MQVYQIETRITKNGTLNIKGLPLHRGDKVEVTVKKIPSPKASQTPYPLRGNPVYYKDPFDSV